MNVATWSNQEECSGTTDATSSEHLQHEEVCVPQVSGDENAFSGLSAQGPVYTMSSLERKFALGWEDVEMGRSSERTRGAEGTTSRYNCSDDMELVKGDGQSLTRQSNESTATPHSMSSFETFLAVKKSGEDGRLNFIKESPSRKFSNFSQPGSCSSKPKRPTTLNFNMKKSTFMHYDSTMLPQSSNEASSSSSMPGQDKENSQSMPYSSFEIPEEYSKADEEELRKMYEKQGARPKTRIRRRSPSPE